MLYYIFYYQTASVCSWLVFFTLIISVGTIFPYDYFLFVCHSENKDILVYV